MSICTLNLTIGIFTMKNLEFSFRVTRKRIYGALGVFLDKFVAGTEERLCTFRPAHTLGEKLENGSFTGVKGMILKRQLDLSLKIENLVGLAGLEDFMEIAAPSFTEDLKFGQFLNAPTPQNKQSLAFLSHSIVVVNVMAIGCLITLLVSLFIWSPKSAINRTGFVQRLHKKIKRFLFCATQSGASRRFPLTRYNIVMLSFFVFLMISVSVFRSLVQTNGVVVNLSELIDSKAKLLATKRYHCGFSEKANPDYIEFFKKQNYLSKVLAKKRPGGECFLDTYFRTPVLVTEFEFTRTFFILSKMTLSFIVSYLSQVAQQKIVFESTFLNSEIIQSHLVSAFLETRLKARVHFKLKKSFESGLLDVLKGDIQKKLADLNRCDFLYTNARDLIVDFTKVIKAIEFAYFKSLFVYLIAASSLLCLLFVFDLCLRRIRKKSKRKSLLICR